MLFVNGIMDINHINLNIPAVVQLYPGTLVDLSSADNADTVTHPVTAEVNNPPGKTVSVKSLGNNRKKILVLVNYPDAEFIPDDTLSFMTGILEACKLSLDDVALVNLFHYPEIGYKQLLTEYKSRIVLLFEAEPASLGLPMSFPHYQLQNFAGNTFLYAPSLNQLENNKLEKSKLWVCLKRLFNL